MKKGFTLIEVNLAMLIMAGGILSIVGLYSLGFRENRQSREDIAAAAMADSVLAPLAAALSATNLPWTIFRDLENYPKGNDTDKGWSLYFNKKTGIVEEDPQGTAQDAFQTLMEKVRNGNTDLPTTIPQEALQMKTGLSPALVVLHDKGSAVVRLGFRAVNPGKPGQLMSMPLFYTEVRFQGDASK